MAFQRMIARGELKQTPMKRLAAAVSAGIFEGKCCLDLNYHEDKDASVDFNYAMTEDLDLIEMQGSGEEATFTESEMLEMLALSKAGVTEIARLQREALAAFVP